MAKNSQVKTRRRSELQSSSLDALVSRLRAFHDQAEEMRVMYLRIRQKKNAREHAALRDGYRHAITLVKEWAANPSSATGRRCSVSVLV